MSHAPGHRRARHTWTALRSGLVGGALVLLAVLALVSMHSLGPTGPSVEVAHAGLPSGVSAQAAHEAQAPHDARAPLPAPAAHHDGAECTGCAGDHSDAVMVCALFLVLALTAAVPPALRALRAPMRGLPTHSGPLPSTRGRVRTPSLLVLCVCRT